MGFWLRVVGIDCLDSCKKFIRLKKKKMFS